MDVDSWPARVLGNRWPWFMEMHLTYFSPRTLTRLLEQVGFGSIRTTRLGRYLRLSYLATRLECVSPRLSQGLRSALQSLRLAETPILIRAADLFTLFAQKQ
jgi:hypothetical protein